MNEKDKDLDKEIELEEKEASASPELDGETDVDSPAKGGFNLEKETPSDLTEDDMDRDIESGLADEREETD
ncbi:hypothetical protein K0U00_48560, partial [Paenibacillus sepulcri]|nr:hypothetical protein [Paenibacillus sepulcri]